MKSPFRYFNSSPEVIRLTVMLYIRYQLSLRQVEDILFERGIDICHETVRLWWNRFGPMFAAEIRKRWVHHASYSRWRWHLGDVFVRINGETHYLWRAVDHEGEVLVHSDQGSQFTSIDWASFLKAHNLEHSMSRRGNCHDNAVAESFFNLLKRERIRRRTYKTRAEARQDVFDYIEMFYNPKRKHVRNGMLSPVEFERQQEMRTEGV